MLSGRHLRRLAKKEKEKLLLGAKFENSETNELSIQSQNSEDDPLMHCDQDPGITIEKSNCESTENNTLTEKLREWFVKYNPSRQSFDSLLQILRSENLNVPISSKTIAKPTKNIVIRTVSPGTYLHVGIEKQLRKISEMLEEETEIVMDIGIDGLPLFKSSRQTLWPIMGRIAAATNIDIMLIGVYLGSKKPYSIDNYLHDFVEELKTLTKNGFTSSNKVIAFKIGSFVCDAPARSFICGTVGHNSLHGCSKCIQLGKRVNNVVTYSTTSAILRTDDDFAQRKYKDYHKPIFRDRKSSLESVEIKMITQFPLDPMHLIDLGVTRKIILCLLNGNMSKQKLSQIDKEMISTKLVMLAPFIPREFARKPRRLEEILKWKAVEFRQFILYTGTVVLKGVVDEDCYYHFCLLHCAYRLLACKKSYRTNLATASEMLKLFVEQFPIIYSEESLTYNVHSLLHITDCIKSNGHISHFSVYPFENYMQELKRKVKKPTKILQQINNKIAEESLTKEDKTYGFKRNIKGEIISYSTPGFFLSALAPDNYCCVNPFTSIKIINFLECDNRIHITGKRLLNCRNFYNEPLQSMPDLGIFLASAIVDDREEIFDTKAVLFKFMCLPYNEDLLLIPIIHTYN